ncbi:Protein of unknown function [Gryllus bimaculatus]|nr:Protein of unknown function [Gryllus bimaculatus]
MYQCNEIREERVPDTFLCSIACSAQPGGVGGARNGNRPALQRDTSGWRPCQRHLLVLRQQRRSHLQVTDDAAKPSGTE